VKVRGFRIEVGEIEAALAALPAVREAVVEARAGAGANSAHGNNRLVAYVVPATELAAEAPELRPDALRRALQQTLPEHMLPTAWVVLAALPLTPHGKVDRRALPDPDPAPAAGGGAVGDAAPGGTGGQPQTRVEEQLAAIWAEVLGRGEVGRDDNFFALGGDSILSIQVVVRAQRLGIAISPKLLFQHQTLAALAAVAGSAPRIAAEQGAVVGPVPLTPVQRLLFAGDPPAPHHDNQALLLELDRRLAPRALRAAFAALTAHHDALRLRFRRTAERGWEQHSMPPGEEALPCAVIDLSALEGKSVVTGAIEAAAAGVQASLDLAAGPVQRLVYFDLGARQSGRLLWVLNHLVVDGVSWRLLLADLAALYEQAERGVRSYLLPPKSTSFKAWAEKLASWAATPDLMAELGYWRGLPWTAVQPMPGGAGEADNGDAGLAGDERTAVMTLSPEDTQALLHEVPRPYGTQIQEALLSALARAVRAWSGAEVALVDVEGHGREEIFPDVDLTRTVGWFTSVVPAVLDLRAVRGGEGGEAGEAGEALKAVKEQLRQLPHGGVGYGVLRYLSGAADELAALPSAGMSFNYLGQLDQALPADSPFRPAGESAGAARSPLARRHHPLAWSGGVMDGRLQLVCAYDARHYGAATIGQLTAGLEASLRQLIAHCRQPETGGYTPSDFPLTGLDQAKLNRILAARKGVRP
jgi:non-ribosomal peptide synthase protein (TIGR01720 family)